jgi:signal transduction histidine kinase
VRPATEAESLLNALDVAADGILFADVDGRFVHCNLAFRRSAEVLGLPLDGAFVDRVLDLADRTTQPYAFTAAVVRLRDEPGDVEFEDAAIGRVFRLEGSAAGPAGRVWTMRDVTGLREEAGARDERVAALGHELRTPLTAMTGFIELLRDGSAGPLTPDQERYLDIVGRAAERLQSLVDELLRRSDDDPVTKGPAQPNDVREA